jgi:uncharacterized protein (DUF885 family)
MVRFSLRTLAAASTLVLAACGGAPAPPPATAVDTRAGAPGERLMRLVEGYWDDYRRLNPQNLPQGPDTRYDAAGGWDISPQFLADSRELERRYLEAVLTMPRARLDSGSQLTYDLFRRERELAAESFTYPTELVPLNPFDSMPLWFAQTGAGRDQYAILSAKDLESWRARADGYARWTAQAIANMREGLRRGYTLPRPLISAMLPMLAALGEDTPANVFYQPQKSLPATLDESERSRLADGIRTGVKQKILPSYRSLHDFLRDEYLPRARQSVGLSALPLGESWYAFLIKRETSSRLSAGEIHALGLAETERLHGRVQTLLAEAGFTGTAQAFSEAMRRDPRLTYKSAEELLNYYSQQKLDNATAIATLFEHTPQADFAIRRLDAFREATEPALTYQRASPNGNSAAVLYVNVAGMEAQPVMASQPLFLREALPGHHEQLALQAERLDLPRFRRYGGSPAFVEGWALYAESLGEELGLYRDAESKFAALSDQLECAAGLVIDTGLHSLGWSRSQALDYVRAQVPIDEAAARNAVDRVIALPGRALACTLGARAILGLRTRAEQALGARFDLRAFHAELIDDGAMPLDILESVFTLRLNGSH